MAFMTETAKYETKNVENMIRGSRNITFLNIFSVGKEILRIEAETYYVEDVLENGDVINIIGKFIANSDPCAKLNIVCKDERKRRPETLRKVGVTLEELRNGMEKKEMTRAVSDYFIKYDGIIVSCKPYSIISMLNNDIIESKYKSIDNSYFDIKRMAKKCGENFTDKNSLENLKETFIDCTGSYRRMKKMEQRMYMTTGELAKLMGITKETLFHYDEIGLFRPAVVMKNRYRYYEVGGLQKKRKKKMGCVSKVLILLM